MTILFCVPIVFLIVSVAFSIRAVKRGKKTSRAVATQLIAFLAVCIVTFAAPMIASAAPEDSEPAAAPVTTSDTAAAPVDNSKGLIAAALVTGLAGIGGGVAVAAAAPAAIGATSEDPKAFGKSLIFVALGEGIALYGLLISILILNKV